MSNMILNNNVLDILESFSEDYNKKIYGRGIAKRLKMNQKTASNILNKLEREHILRFSIEGKNKYYYLNNLNQNIKEIIKMIEIRFSQFNSIFLFTTPIYVRHINSINASTPFNIT